jgi:SAM-dependent methyltransferase
MDLKELALLAVADSALLRGMYVTLRGAYKLHPRYADNGSGVDEHYTRDEWFTMRTFADAGRYGLLAEWVRRLAPEGPVLDIGAGDGLFVQALGRDVEYLGVDFAAETVAAMQQKFGGPKRQFVVGDATTYVPSRRYPIILFNDMLYQLEDPVRHVQRLAAFLEPGGTIIVASYLAGVQLRLLDALLKAFDVEEQGYFRNSERRTFFQVALRPRLLQRTK